MRAQTHLPGYLDRIDEVKKYADEVAVVCVNDPWCARSGLLLSRV